MALQWWQRGVFYQIYPRSFADSNGDGIGDLDGVTAHLDYLESLGIDAIWLNPINPSPLEDWGYDISDYCGIHPDLGDLAAFDRLVAEAHRRGIRVIVDLVPNHTSDQASMVRRVALVAHQSQTRLVHLDSRHARSSADQLGELLRRQYVEVRSGDRGVVPAHVSASSSPT